MMKIPETIKKIIKKLESEGFEAYMVGGCVRDILRGESPVDFDIATSAIPKEIGSIFKNSFTDNNFGTVTLIIEEEEEENLQEVQITPYRTEKGYKDKRHPDEVSFTKSIQEDLKRRDFTVNAMAMGLDGVIIDPYKGKKDLGEKVIRAVGDPEERLAEDGLRLMRAVRLATTLDFSIEKETEEAIKRNSHLLQEISRERIRDELIKIIMTEKAAEGVEGLRKLDLLDQFLPEILEGYKVAQNKHHVYDCYEHSIQSLKYAAKKGFGMHVRMAALLHDIGKPRVKEGEGENATFYNHEIVGARITREVLKRLKFKKKDIEKITLLVRYHLFYYNVGEVSESSVRRLLKNVGKENIEELLEVRMADRIGSGVPKAEPYKLRHMRYLIDKVSQDPISVNMLKVGGDDVMKIMGVPPGKIIGEVLNILLIDVINDPSLNKKETLKKKIEEMKVWREEEVREKAKEAKKEAEKMEVKRDEMTKKKYWVT